MTVSQHQSSKDLCNDSTADFSHAYGCVIVDELLLCLREALSNVARHACATNAEVAVSVHAGRVSLTVIDDGVGYVPTTDVPSSGLHNMLVCAESLGGRFAIDARDVGGTVTTWDVPLE